MYCLIEQLGTAGWAVQKTCQYDDTLRVELDALPIFLEEIFHVESKFLVPLHKIPVKKILNYIILLAPYSAIY